MGQAGSHGPAPAPPRARRSLTLPHDPPRLAPKVLPPLCESPRLRSTDNGAILHSGGTISGRRPTTAHEHVPHGHVHANVFRSRSTGTSSDETRPRERDPLHRSHTNLDIRQDANSNVNKRFGSEPDLRIEEEQKSKNSSRHFRKKYRAPPPPAHDTFEGSSPDSSEGNARAEPQRKLRLFKTRNETKKLNGLENFQFRNSIHECKSLDSNDQFERRYRSPCKDKEQHLKYPDNDGMTQSTASLKREERLLQSRDYRNTRIDRLSGCHARTSKNENSEAWKTPLLNRNFRHSERFRKEENELPKLRRERTFDESLIGSDRDTDSSRALHENRMKAIDQELKNNKPSPLAIAKKPLRKSLPSLLMKNNEEKDEFQAELEKATSRIRNQLVNRINDSKITTTSQDETSERSPTKIPSKVKQSSPPNVVKKPDSKVVDRKKSFNRTTEEKPKTSVNSDPKVLDHKQRLENRKNNRRLPDRGQASGKESTPEHSPNRLQDSLMRPTTKDKQKQQPPSKQFYFGMAENKQVRNKEHLKDFPGLGSPIIQEISNFHLIEKKLLNYQEKHNEEDEFDKFNAKIKEERRMKNLSSESALSSEGSEGSWDAGSLGIALRLRPTLPKKQRTVPRFSPQAAWRQLATLDDHLAAETQPLAVETKMSGNISAESSPRSDQSADKSGDSGISGDHAHSDHRIDSPRHHVQKPIPATWTPQQDLGDSSSEGAGAGLTLHTLQPTGNVASYSPATQPFSLSLPRDNNERGKQVQQGFNSLQKIRKSVSGALGALGTRRFDLENEPMLQEQEQNWFLTKSAPNSLNNNLMFQQPTRAKGREESPIKEEELPSFDKEEPCSWRPGASYLSWSGHVMYLPPAPEQPLSMMGPIERPIRSKSSGCLEVSARAARAALCSEMRERERSASPVPGIARAMPATVLSGGGRSSNTHGSSRSKRFTFQSTVRQLERRRIAEKLSKEADLKEQQRRTELEAMRRVEEEFQRKRAREKANIRQQLRLVSSGAVSMPTTNSHHKIRDEPDGSCRESPTVDRSRENRQRHSNASSEISGRSKSTTPIRSVELSEWRTERGARVYRDWAPAHAHAHPPACARMPIASHALYNGGEAEAFSGSPRSDNYRLEFARGRSSASPRTPRAPRLLGATREPSSSGSDLSLRQPIKIRW